MPRPIRPEWKLLGTAYALMGSVLLAGCVNTNTVLRVGVGYDITDKINGCERGLYGCGHPGTRETATIELLWSPSIKAGPYAGYSHHSHYSTGFPVGGIDADFSDEIGGGYFFQFGGGK